MSKWRGKTKGQVLREENFPQEQCGHIMGGSTALCP